MKPGRRQLVRNGLLAALAAAPLAIGAPLRDPFLPIGYQPPPPPMDTPPPSHSHVPAVSPPRAPSPEQWDEALRQVRVQGITRRGERAVAVVNGRVLGVGDRIELRWSGFVFQWRVEAIDARGVKLVRIHESGDDAEGTVIPATSP